MIRLNSHRLEGVFVYVFKREEVEFPGKKKSFLINPIQRLVSGTSTKHDEIWSLFPERSTCEEF